MVSIQEESNAKPDSQQETRIVNSHNEWDPLEEVIVGRIEASIFPERHIYILGALSERLYNLLFFMGGLKRWPKKWFFDPAKRELDVSIS